MVQKFLRGGDATLAIVLALALGGCGTPEAALGSGQAAPAAAATPNHCGVTISRSFAGYDLEDLAWTSRLIVAGTVAERLSPVVAPAIAQGPPEEGGQREGIYTDYVVRVERPFRGLSATAIRVRLPGGTIGNCTQEYPSEPRLAVGDRLLFFLTGPAAQTAAVPVYNINAGPQGVWAVQPDGTVTPGARHLQPHRGASLDQVGQRIHTALAGPPPTKLPSIFLVPLDEAPLPAAPTPRRP